ALRRTTGRSTAFTVGQSRASDATSLHENALAKRTVLPSTSSARSRKLAGSGAAVSMAGPATSADTPCAVQTASASARSAWTGVASRWRGGGGATRRWRACGGPRREGGGGAPPAGARTGGWRGGHPQNAGGGAPSGGLPKIFAERRPPRLGWWSAPP